MGTRGLPAAFLVVGEAIQSISLGIMERGDPNTSFFTRSVGTMMIVLGVALGTVIACLGSPLSEGLIFSALTVPIVRADLIARLLSRFVHIFIWTGKLHPAKLNFASEVYPLQVAAIIWNDCAPASAHSRGEDEHAVVWDMLDEQRSLWRPSVLDSWVARVIKAPLFVILYGLVIVVEMIEAMLVAGWRLSWGGSARHITQVPVMGRQRAIVGHATLVTDPQLTWIQDTMRRQADPDTNREMRPVLVRALHAANLLGHGGYTRLHEHAPHGHAMSEFYQRLTNAGLKAALTTSSMDALGVLGWCPNGNSIELAKPAPRQVLWARLVVGSDPAPGFCGRWRGPAASALLVLAQEHHEQWGASVNRTAIHRHVYSVTRRWLVDWTMFLWWDLGTSDEAAHMASFFSSRMRGLLQASLAHNTWSLPHAVGELAWSTPRPSDVEAMLSATLGVDWHSWLAGAVTASGVPMGDAAAQSGEWKCVGQEVDANVAVDQALYAPRVMSEVLSTGGGAPVGDQVRAVLAGRVVDTLTQRANAAWQQLPHQLLDPPEAIVRDADP